MLFMWMSSESPIKRSAVSGDIYNQLTLDWAPPESRHVNGKIAAERVLGRLEERAPQHSLEPGEEAGAKAESAGCGAEIHDVLVGVHVCGVEIEVVPAWRLQIRRQAAENDCPSKAQNWQRPRGENHLVLDGAVEVLALLHDKLMHGVYAVAGMKEGRAKRVASVALGFWGDNLSQAHSLDRNHEQQVTNTQL